MINDLILEFSDNDVGRLQRCGILLSNATVDFQEEDFVNKMNDEAKHLITTGSNYSSTSFRHEIFVLLVKCALHKEKQKLYHPAYAHIAETLTKDEWQMLQILQSETPEFVKASDLDPVKGFINSRYVKKGFDENTLNEPDRFYVTVFHLQDVLKLIRWPIYNQEAIMEAGTQTGNLVFSRLILTTLGHAFMDALNLNNENTI